VAKRNDMSEQCAKGRVVQAGYLPWAMDPSGRRFVAPDGFRILTLEQAVAELGDNEEAA
jgi:hypothetical protein